MNRSPKPWEVAEAMQDVSDALFNQPDESNAPGPWFTAVLRGPCIHGDSIIEGDTIRATRYGKYEHRECAESAEEMESTAHHFDSHGVDGMTEY